MYVCPADEDVAGSFYAVRGKEKERYLPFCQLFRVILEIRRDGYHVCGRIGQNGCV